MLVRLQTVLGNTFGNVAVWADPDQSWAGSLSFAPETQSVTTVQSPLDGAWDCLVCCGELWNMGNLEPITEALGSDRRLFFVEPVAAFGLANRAQRSMRPLIKSRFGLDFHSDLPQEMRDAGLTPTSVDRFRIGSPLFTFVAGEARRY